MGNPDINETIYAVLTSGRFRAGPLPPEATKRLVIDTIRSKVSQNSPIKLFHFWGGGKNPNLPTASAGLCEEASLDYFQKLNLEVKKIYPPGMKIYIFSGDERVERTNHIPHERTKKYVETLAALTKREKYGDLFTMVTVSSLYAQHSKSFERKLKELDNPTFFKKLENYSGFQKLISNAKKNIFTKALSSEDFQAESVNCAKRFILYRIAEEDCLLFRDFADCIRSYYTKYAAVYNILVKDITHTKPRLDCTLFFFTGGKGNITQPWQAIGRKGFGGKVIFLSQEKLSKQAPRCLFS